MPSCIEHTIHCWNLYGLGGSDIHEWMDGPVTIIGGSHRRFRHDPNMKIPQKFINKYGEEIARNIILDHLYLDKELEDKNTYKKIENLERIKEVGLPIDFLFNESPYEYHTQKWWDWKEKTDRIEAIEIVVKKIHEAAKNRQETIRIKLEKIHGTKNKDYFKDIIRFEIEKIIKSKKYEGLYFGYLSFEHFGEHANIKLSYLNP